MNFFGHAVVARWRCPSPEFVLGAMLPDFATMIYARPPEVMPGDLAEGQAFHIETDRVFHQAPTFLELQRTSRRDLRDRGLGRGSALAVGHIGVEILLDATLASEDAAVRAYLDALAQADAHARSGNILWRNDEEAARFENLIRVLSARGVTSANDGTDIVAFRLERALAGRPRLAFDGAGADIVRIWAAEAAPAVERGASTLMAELCQGLALAR